MTWLARAGGTLWTHRQRWAPAVLIVGLAVVIGQASTAVPREVALRYRLGPSHESIIALELSYRLGEDEMAGARFAWPEGAPRSVEHRLDLAPGEYQVRAQLTHREGRRQVDRRFEVPSEGAIRIDLYAVGYAHRPEGTRPSPGRASPAG